MVNLEQCHLSLSQMVTVFNSIIESQDLRLRELDITGNDSFAARYLLLRVGGRQKGHGWGSEYDPWH